jgi:2-polyprenyl-3-methyl-5-hydroxy-6-metoxy-1,4-benzoquinol methylase
MENWLTKLLSAIAQQNPAHAKKLRRQLPFDNVTYSSAAERFFSHWLGNNENYSLDDIIADYLSLIEEMAQLQKNYATTGRYPNTSFKAVCEDFYSDSARMNRHLNGLALAQFLWIDQIQRFEFFNEWIGHLESGPYMEIGPGHGLYLETAFRLGQQKLSPFVVIDVSQSSLDRARFFVGEQPSYHLCDFLEFSEKKTFGAIAFGEVLEHVEEPSKFLGKLHSLLNRNGSVFFSSPIHAPMPDHIIAYESIDQLRELLRENQFHISEESICAVDNLDIDVAHRLKLPMMYSAILKKV